MFKFSGLLTLISSLEYDIEIFNGRKLLHFQEINSLGGGNTFLGTVFISSAGAAVVIMIVFLVLYVAKISKNPDFYEVENAKW